MTHSPIGVAGEGERAAAIAGRIAKAPGQRIIVHGFALPGAGTRAQTPRTSRVERASTLFDLASECEVVIAVYGSHAALIAALAGTADRPGLAGAMAPGSILADFSEGSPEQCRHLAGRLSPRAIGFVECGVIGGTEAMARGETLVFAGGFDAHIDSVKPILSALGRFRRVGPQGSGRMYAALTQAMTAAHALALDEVHAIAAAGGFVPDDLASPPMLEAERHELTRHLEQARTWAHACGVATPVIDAVAAHMTESIKRP